MENLNIRLYKDGDDLIVVYKGGAKDIEELSKKILSPLNSQQVPVKEIPDLIPVVEPEEKSITVKEAEEKYEDIYPAFTEEDGEEIKEEKQEEVYEENIIPEKLNFEDVLKKDGFKGFVTILNDIKTNTVLDKDREEAIKAVKEYYLKNKDNIKDSNRTIKPEEIKKLIRISYSLFKEEMDTQLNKKGFANIDMALTTMSQFDARGFYWNQVSNNIDKFMKTL